MVATVMIDGQYFGSCLQLLVTGGVWVQRSRWTDNTFGSCLQPLYQYRAEMHQSE